MTQSAATRASTRASTSALSRASSGTASTTSSASPAASLMLADHRQPRRQRVHGLVELAALDGAGEALPVRSPAAACAAGSRSTTTTRRPAVEEHLGDAAPIRPPPTTHDRLVTGRPVRERLAGRHGRSTSIATPCPTPTHNVARPRRQPSRSSRPSRVTRMRDAGRAERVTERDGAAVGVDDLLVQLQPAHDRQALGGERLVQLDGVEVRDASSRRGPAPSRSPAPGRGPSGAARRRRWPSRRPAPAASARTSLSALLADHEHAPRRRRTAATRSRR